MIEPRRPPIRNSPPLLVLSFIRGLTLLTIVCWLWLLWNIRQQVLLVFPAFVVVFGLYAYQVLVVTDEFERWRLFVQLRRLLLSCILIFLSQVFLPVIWMAIGATIPLPIQVFLSWGAPLLYFLICLLFSFIWWHLVSQMN